MLQNIHGYKYAHIEIHSFSSLCKHFCVCVKKNIGGIWRGCSQEGQISQATMLWEQQANEVMVGHPAVSHSCTTLAALFLGPASPWPSLLRPRVTLWCDGVENRHELPASGWSSFESKQPLCLEWVVISPLRHSASSCKMRLEMCTCQQSWEV